MRQRVHSGVFFARQARVRAKMARMRAAKARKRQRLIDEGLLEHEPKMERWFRFEYGVRDKLTGDMHFRDLSSVRQASKALGLILKFY